MLEEKRIKLEKRSRDVILIGRVAIDLNPTDINRPLEESSEFKKYLGGSPANIAIGLTRLDKKVGFIGAISNDSHGKFVSNYFENNGVDVRNLVKIEGKRLGLTFTEIKSPTESSILMYRDEVADLYLPTSAIHEEYIKDHKCLVISGTALAKSPSREAVLKALEYAKNNDLIIVFDIDYRPYTWQNATEIAIYTSLVAKQSDIIIGSREEFTLMEIHLNLKSESDEESANYWHNQGVELLIIKHGKKGSNAFLREKEMINVLPYNVKLLKSFGGGDAYASAFIYGLLEGYVLEEALQLGSAHAAMLVASHSCSEDMKTIEEIKKFQKENSND